MHACEIDIYVYYNCVPNDAPYRRSLMSIYKSWINLRNQLPDQYFNGAQVFTDIAKNYVNE